MPTDLLPWSRAWERSAFGAAGFYRRHEPARHFETDVMAGDSLARALAGRLVSELTRLIDVHGAATVTDVGAADGALLAQLAAIVPAQLRAFVTWRGIDIRPQPVGWPSTAEYVAADAREWAHEATPGPGLLIAHEFLDDLPVEVLEVDDDGRLRVVLVDPATGEQVVGPDLADDPALAALGLSSARLAHWCDRWWPRREPAARVEAGWQRDEAWRALTSTVADGLAIAIDYGHVRADRDRGGWDGGTLAGYRAGRLVRAVPNGTVNITAHVAMDSCAAAAPSVETMLEQASNGLWWLVQRMAR